MWIHSRYIPENNIMNKLCDAHSGFLFVCGLRCSSASKAIYACLLFMLKQPGHETR